MRTEDAVQLLIAVINREEMVEDVLAGFLEIGITGATIINTEGMGRLLSAEVPIFAGVEALASRSRPRNQTLFSVIADPALVDRALEVIRRACDMDEPATGIAMVIPVTRVVGLAPELGGG
jgi:nitrogen regulatory protein P-II 1